MPPSVEEKREAAIAKREAEKKAKNKEIADKKKEAAEGRQKEKTAKEQEQAAADAKKAELQKKRDENISKKEGERADKSAAVAGKKSAGKSKYSKKDVFELKQVFDEYDKDRGGTISLEEFTGSLKKKKEANAPRAGERSTREQRQQSEGVSIFEMVRAAPLDACTPIRVARVARVSAGAPAAGVISHHRSRLTRMLLSRRASSTRWTSTAMEM